MTTKGKEGKTERRKEAKKGRREEGKKGRREEGKKERKKERKKDSSYSLSNNKHASISGQPILCIPYGTLYNLTLIHISVNKISQLNVLFPQTILKTHYTQVSR